MVSGLPTKTLAPAEASAAGPATSKEALCLNRGAPSDHCEVVGGIATKLVLGPL